MVAVPVELPCTCVITDDGRFEVGPACQNCRECNIMPQVHPFGPARFG